MGTGFLWRRTQCTSSCEPFGIVVSEAKLIRTCNSFRASGAAFLRRPELPKQSENRGRFVIPQVVGLEQNSADSFDITRVDMDPVETVVGLTSPNVALAGDCVWHESKRMERTPDEQSLWKRYMDDLSTLTSIPCLSDAAEFDRKIRMSGDQAAAARKLEFLINERQEQLGRTLKVHGG